jgi:serine phosphatase RsbU (regulator of sigma subunit)
MEAQVAVAKIGKYATSESGDSLEMIERPGGGLSIVLVDGQRSGKPAKRISNVVTRKAISLLGEGVRDGATARAASDYLFTYRAGKVMATMNILSIDLMSRTFVITRNNPAPVILVKDSKIEMLDDPSDPVGTRQGTRPSIREIPIELNMAVVIFTDGLTHAGSRTGKHMDIPAFVSSLARDNQLNPHAWADDLLEHAVSLDDGRPSDDISVLIAAILPKKDDDVRRLTARMPIR